MKLYLLRGDFSWLDSALRLQHESTFDWLRVWWCNKQRKENNIYHIQIWLPIRGYWGCGNCTSRSHGTLANSSTDELTPRISKMPPYQGCVQTYLRDGATFDGDNHFTITWSGQVKAVIILDWGRLIRKTCQQSQKAEQKKKLSSFMNGDEWPPLKLCVYQS